MIERIDVTAWLNREARQFARSGRIVLGIGAFRFVIVACSYFVMAPILADFVLLSSRPERSQWFLLTIVFGLQIVTQWFAEQQKIKLGTQVVEHYQQRLIDHLRRHSLATLRDHTTAVWQSVFIARIPALQGYFCEYLPQARLAALVPVLVLLLVLPISWLAAILLFVSAPLIPLFMWLVGKGAVDEQQKNFVALERLGSIFTDRLRARQLLHVHNAVEQQGNVFALASRAVKSRTLVVLRKAFLSSSVLEFFSTLGVALVAVFVGFSLLGNITFGSWENGLVLSEGLFVLLLTPLFFSELKLLGRNYHLRSEAIAAAEFIVNLLEGDGTSAEPEAKAPDTALYPRNRALKIVDCSGACLLFVENLEIFRNDKILLHGKSGSGKTTLLEVLLGMRPLQNNCQQVFAKDCVAWLGQNPGLTAGSVRQNITQGCTARDALLYDLLREVEMLPWLRQLPEGLDTPLGDYPPLSGGQQQRLAIARLLFFNKPVVVLDEPTAHLSVSQAVRISQLLKTRLADKTVIWASHEQQKESYFNQHWVIDATAGKLTPIRDQSLCA